ncbi:MAG TPA: hypothetical protein VG435_13580 [Acidimicrobiales bacterium]|jgi:hypothetical protein|nr:hypothetical protein [Acidimicrobiales bacterium]
MSVKPRFSMRPADRRLMGGYGPGLFIAVGFAVMALLVPTVAPAKDVSVGSGGNNFSTSGLNPATGLPASGSGSSSSVPGGTGSGGVSGATGGHGGGSTGSTAGVGGGSGTGTGGSGGGSGATAATGKVAACTGKQVSGDPYSPPCISFSGGNGGATSHGVTANQIVVTFRIPADNLSSFNGAIQQIAGKYNSAAFSDSQADVERTIQDLVTYFNSHFQFYGRKILLKFYNGTGQLVQEVTDAGQSNADADALNAAKTQGAFADISALTQPYAEALSGQGVINVGSPYMSQSWYQQHAPYAWSIYPDCTELGTEAAGVAVKQIIGRNVTFGGTGVSDGKPRRIAVLAPDNPVYQSCAAQVTGALKSAGHPAVANLSYTLDLSQLSQEASSIEQQIVNDNITTVMCGCDPITLIYLTGDLDNAHYEPEFFNIGAAFTDEDLLAQLFDQGSWAYAAGVTNNGTVPPYGSSLGYFAAKSADPSHPPAHSVDIFYEDLYVLALGIELAGPNLNPANFAKGLFSYGGGNGEYGPWSFNVNGSGYFTPQHEFRYEWWNPKATSGFDNEAGTWEVGSNWYSNANIPSGPLPVFPQGPQ